MIQANVSGPRLLAAAAFLTGTFAAAFGFARRSGGGIGVGLTGSALLLWGMRELARDAASDHADDRVTAASEDSFPASDAPAWTPTSRSGGPKVH